MFPKICNAEYFINFLISVLTGGRDFKVNLLDARGTYKILLSV